MGPHISPVGWQLDRAAGSAAPGAVGQIRFQEYGSTDLAQQPLDLSDRLPTSRQLSAVEAADLRKIGHVLRGWSPEMW